MSNGASTLGVMAHMVNMKEFKLNNNVLMPRLGIGTFLLEPNDAYNSVLNALKLCNVETKIWGGIKNVK